MTLITHSHPVALPVALDDIIRTHGRWRILLALFARRPAPLFPLGLNNHLRRDIGLDPQAQRPDWLR